VLFIDRPPLLVLLCWFLLTPRPPQVPDDHPAAAGAREGVVHPHDVRDAALAEVLRAPVPEGGLGVALGRDHVRDDQGVERVVGLRGHGHVADQRAGLQVELEGVGGEVLAAAPDDVHPTASEREAAVLLPDHEIAGAQPGPAGAVVDHGLGGGLRRLVVAPHQRTAGDAPDPQLTGLAVRDVRA
jgi:hypothetical protein